MRFTLNLPMDWTGSQGFDPGLGSGSSAHIFLTYFTIAMGGP